jgi:hypothetical protein
LESELNEAKMATEANKIAAYTRSAAEKDFKF